MHTGASFTVTGIKVEAASFEEVSNGARLDGAAMEIAKGAIKVMSLGFLKL
jgi:hypothetical protein